MYCTMRMLAAEYHCSVDTIRRRVAEMERSGLYPMAVRRIKGMEIDMEQFERFCCQRKRGGRWEER